MSVRAFGHAAAPAARPSAPSCLRDMPACLPAPHARGDARSPRATLPAVWSLQSCECFRRCREWACPLDWRGEPVCQEAFRLPDTRSCYERVGVPPDEQVSGRSSQPLEAGRRDERPASARRAPSLLLPRHQQRALSRPVCTARVHAPCAVSLASSTRWFRSPMRWRLARSNVMKATRKARQRPTAGGRWGRLAA